MEPLLSCVVPVYNGERYLRQCLESLMAQTLCDLEVVCVDDGSTDGSAAIIASLAERDPRLRVVSKPNSGYGDSLNQGIAAARGRWVAILEADDFIEPDAYEAMVEAGEAADVAVVKADFFLHWTHGGYDRRFGWTEPSLTGIVWPQCEREVFFRKPSIWSAIYRRDFLAAHDVACLATPGASYQDAGFQFKSLAAAERVLLLDRAFVHYRQDNEASSVRSREKAFCVCDEFDAMATYAARDPERARWLAPTICRMRYDTYLWNYDRLGEELKPAFLERMRADFIAEDEAGLADPSLFAPAAWRYRAFIAADDGTLFEPMHELVAGGSTSKAATLAHYARQGGLPLVGRVTLRTIADKLAV